MNAPVAPSYLLMLDGVPSIGAGDRVEVPVRAERHAIATATADGQEVTDERTCIAIVALHIALRGMAVGHIEVVVGSEDEERRRQQPARTGSHGIAAEGAGHAVELFDTAISEVAHEQSRHSHWADVVTVIWTSSWTPRPRKSLTTSCRIYVPGLVRRECTRLARTGCPTGRRSGRALRSEGPGENRRRPPPCRWRNPKGLPPLRVRTDWSGPA